MDTLHYFFGKNEHSPITNLYLDDETLRVCREEKTIAYPLTLIRRVNLGYHPESKEQTAYSCTLTFEDGFLLEVMDNFDKDYVNFVLTLHQVLLPHVKNISFTKTFDISNFRYTASNILRLAISLVLLIVFSPLIFLIILIGLPFWGFAVVGLFINLLVSLSYYLHHNRKSYAPTELPELQIPTSGRQRVHDFAINH